MKANLIHLLRGAAASLFAAFILPAAAAESQEGVVLYVHSEHTTNAFVKKLGRPAGQARGGRFAVVQLVNGSWGEGSYALVWVPTHLSIQAEDRVEVEPSGDHPLVNPGSGVVTRGAPSLASTP
jgi:hypothetical protein